MAKVSVTVAGRGYDLACDDGEEAKVAELAALVDRRASQLIDSVGAIDDRRLFLMVSILLANELQAAHEEPGLGLEGGAGFAEKAGEQQLAQSIIRAAGDLESLAARIEDA